MKLRAFQYGETQINDRMAFREGNEKLMHRIALLFFLIEDRNRKILVDVGCDTMPGFELFDFVRPIDLLATYGILPGDITDIAITHAHHDHIDSLRHFGGQSLYIHKEELGAAARYICRNFKICSFEDALSIGDTVKIIHIGGHTKGSSVVSVLAKGEEFILCGDECYTKENIVLKRPTGSSLDLNKSFDFVSEYSKEQYRPIIFHDPDLVGKIGDKTIFDTEI